MIPLFINCRDRLATVIGLVDWASKLPDVAVYLVDNASTYLPLLDYYATTSATVLLAGENGGSRTPWRFVRDRLDGQQFFAVTDCDIGMSTVPPDVVQQFGRILLDQPHLVKVACALSLDGLPDDHAARKREAEYWRPEIRQDVTIGDQSVEAYRALTATTFAVYRADGPSGMYEPSLRVAGDYACRHVPWYYTADTIPDDERYYLEHVNPRWNYYSNILKRQAAKCV